MSGISSSDDKNFFVLRLGCSKFHFVKTATKFDLNAAIA
jgi:hypothetical protein